MSNIFASSLFPSLEPKVTDSLWFKVDKPCDDESEITKLEEEHQTWVIRFTFNLYIFILIVRRL